MSPARSAPISEAELIAVERRLDARAAALDNRSVKLRKRIEKFRSLPIAEQFQGDETELQQLRNALDMDRNAVTTVRRLIEFARDYEQWVRKVGGAR